MLVCVGAMGVTMGAATPAVAVDTCRLGAYVADLYALDTTTRTIDADIWFWSVCPRPDLEPIKRFEFINASSTRQADQVSVTEHGLYWTYQKVVGTYRENFNLSDYPFDRQTVNFVVEDTRDTSQFVYTPDTVGSTYNHGTRLSSFEITDFRTLVRDHRYTMAFGNPDVRPRSGSAYHQFIIQMRVARNDASGFVKETLPVYVAFLISLVSFFLWSEEETPLLGARLGLLGAALFAIVVNMRAAGQSLGIMHGMTLVDQIHLYSLVYVFIGVATTTYAWRVSIRTGGQARARRVNQVVAVSATSLYLATTGIAITLALQ
ncbi:hypothetical protein GCM10010339_84690 [Streptomyces alanosinicus]|uniref:Uncharacterized protein n=1 Tax=Streptomyces alanosinicus TaxID=68171 RepID=A0A918YT74_9ACTN|nr:hypothetical protein GCM10010339_84690 [Streptomyces alanosinicus]